MICNVTDYMERACGLYGDRRALAAPDTSYTYTELRDRIIAGAARLLPLCSRGERAIVFMDKSPETLALIWSLIYLGVCYTPVDVNMPPERIAKIITRLEPSLIVTDKKREGRMREAVSLSAGVNGDETQKGTAGGAIGKTESGLQGCGNIVIFEDIFCDAVSASGSKEKHTDIIKYKKEYPASVEGLDGDCIGQSVDKTYGDCIGQNIEKAIMERRMSIIDTDLLYIFFTSGSTGEPKGVMISHRAVMDFTESVVSVLDITENEIIGNQGALHFDLSTLDVYASVAAGAQLHLIPRKYFKFPVKLLSYIRDNGISLIYWVPSALVVTANLKALDAVDVSCLKKVTFCGEVMPVKQLNIWKKALPDARFVNFYGPTETTCASTYYDVDRDFDEGDSLPIGRPMPGTRTLLLDDEGGEVLAGETGEIAIAGSGLAYGYYGDEERTAASFVNIRNGACHERFYRTGDLAYTDGNGDLIYVSRKDFQIKYMGHRIELGEIEAALSSIPGVQMSCCVFDEVRQSIGAYVVAAGLEEEEVRISLSQKVNDYMMPHELIMSDSLPLNANGKVDRAMLRQRFSG